MQSKKNIGRWGLPEGRDGSIHYPVSAQHKPTQRFASRWTESQPGRILRVSKFFVVGTTELPNK
jgi:hypothetical protein